MRMPMRNASCARSSTSAWNRVIPFGERHLRRTIAEFIEHCHGERNHQGLANELIEGSPAWNSMLAAFADVSVSAGSPTSTVAQRDETR